MNDKRTDYEKELEAIKNDFDARVHRFEVEGVTYIVEKSGSRWEVVRTDKMYVVAYGATFEEAMKNAR